MRISRSFLVSVLAGLALTVLASGGAFAETSVTSTFQSGCKGLGSYDRAGPIKRSVARNYALVGNLEGYQWGGGCWNNNNVDDQPGDPPQTYSGGEGGDCSGFTFKVWNERSSTSDVGWRYWDKMKNVHGPYASYMFKAGEGAPNATQTKTYAVFMDAFASSSHIGMIYMANTAYNADDIIHAKGESYGTRITRETYRGNTAFGGVRRVGWRPECYPQCT